MCNSSVHQAVRAPANRPRKEITTSSEALTIFDERTSVNLFAAGRPVAESAVLELIRDAEEAPSSYNIQHTRYLAATYQVLKEKVKAISYGQEKVAQCSAALVVLGI